MANIFDKILSKVKSVVAPPMLSPMAEHPENMPKINTNNTVMPDKTTTDPSTKTGYKWAQRYFNSDNSIDKNAFTNKGATVGEWKTVPKKAMATPTLMPSNMKNINLPVATPTITPTQNMGIGTTKKQEIVPGDFYDASQKYGDAMGVPKEVILANSRWEHRNNKNWNEGKYVDNVWWNEAKNTGEESYGPGQINMRWFGPEAVKLGRITTDHPLYITPEKAKDPWGAAEWMAKKFAAEAKKYTNKGLEPDWGAILQGYNSNENDRGKNVKNLIDTTDFVRS